MANPYHDAAGKFTSRNGQLGNIQDAILAQDIDAYLAEASALSYADAVAGHTEEQVRPVHPALVNAEAEIVERDRLIAEGTKAEVDAYMAERINRPEFREMLAHRDAVRVKAKQFKDEYVFLKEAANLDPNFDVEIVRAKGFQLLNAYEELQVLKAQANDYKDITAPLAARATELMIAERQAAGTWREYTADTLNNLVATVEVPSGSRAWLEKRQLDLYNAGPGVGGSDVGKIIGDYKEFHGYEDVLASKLNPITDEQVAEQAAGHADFKGATGRGNAWEELIAQQYAERHPEARITHCKTSWGNKNVPHQLANFDGLMTDEQGHPNGILEIKTASDASKWGPESAGLDGVPPGYRAQVLWYCDAAGFDKGAVAVMIDDHEYREYHFELNDELRAEIARNNAKVAEFVEVVNKRKANPQAKVEKRPVRKGFSDKIVKAAAAGQDEAFSEAAIYREQSIAQVKRRYKTLSKNAASLADHRAALSRLYTEVNPATRKQPLVHIDLETSGATPTSGRIIEVGISTRDAVSGEETERVSQLYGVGRRMERLGATGEVGVHGITIGKIAGKRQFSHPEVQKAILAKLMGGIMVSHNANFEKAWLRQNLDGFWAAERAGKIKVLDTMYLTQRFLPEAESNKLQGMVEFFGDEYKDAHRAANDASMQGVAFAKFANHIYANAA